RVVELLLVVGHEFGALGLLVVGFGEFAPVEDVDRALGAHDGDLGGGPGEVHVRAHALGAHDAVGAAVVLAADDGELGDGGLGVGEGELGPEAGGSVVR